MAENRMDEPNLVFRLLPARNVIESELNRVSSLKKVRGAVPEDISSSPDIRPTLNDTRRSRVVSMLVADKSAWQ